MKFVESVDNEKSFLLDGKEVNGKEINEKIKNLNSNQRIVETENGNMSTVSRMNG